MAKCISFTSTRDSCFRFTFTTAGLKSTTIDLGDGTIIHTWIPKTIKPTKPNLLLIHGLGANAMWQWHTFISPLLSHFNLYVPDLLFFGDSHTTKPERSEQFQAQCLMKSMELIGVNKMNVVGMSYGGFVGYSLAAQFPEVVEKVVICAAGVCLESDDLDKGLLKVKKTEEAVEILLAQTPEKLRELTSISFYKPYTKVPSCILSDFIDVMNTEYFQERKELIEALHKDRKQSDLPKIPQPTLIVWGEHDQIFPVELAHRLKSHLGETAELVIIPKAGHAINMEKPKELYKHLKSFLLDPIPPKPENNGINHKQTIQAIFDAIFIMGHPETVSMCFSTRVLDPKTKDA